MLKTLDAKKHLTCTTKVEHNTKNSKIQQSAMKLKINNTTYYNKKTLKIDIQLKEDSENKNMPNHLYYFFKKIYSKYQYIF